MAITLNLNSLQSRTESSLRKARKAGIALAKKGEVLKKLARFAGFAFGKIVTFFNLDFDKIWDILVDAYFELKTFDWNATNAELQKQIDDNNQRILVAGASALGEYVGFSAFRIATFFSGKIGIATQKRKKAAEGFKVPVLAGRVGLALAEEGNEELMFGFRRFVSTTINAQLSNAFIRFVLTSRRNEWFGQNSITTPQSNGSIATKIDEKIEKLPKFWQRPVEEFVEGIEDGIIEAGYVVAMTIDDHVAAQRYARKESGPYRTLEIKPEKGSNEILTFKGNQLDLVDAVRTTLPVRQLVADRDIGQILGESANESISLKPQLRLLKLQFQGKAEPPFIKDRKRLCSVAEISIPDPKNGISRNDLLNVIKTYQRGNWYVKCTMDSGRQMAGWFASKTEGINILTQLSILSTTDIQLDSFRWSEGQGQSKASEKMYPSHAAVLYPKRKNGKQAGPLGKAERIPLWGEEAGVLP